MRALILVAGAALAVSACSSNEAANNTMNADENLVVDTNAVDANMDMSADANMAMNAADDAANSADAANNAADAANTAAANAQ